MLHFLLMGVLFAFEFAYGAQLAPSFFDGIDQARSVIDKSPEEHQLPVTRQNYRNVLLTTDRLSKDDEADILAGCFLITGHFSEKGNAKAKGEYNTLVTKPTEAAYKGLFKELTTKDVKFEPAYKKNFGLSVVDLLNKASEGSNWKVLFYKRKEIIEEKQTEKQNIAIITNLETKIDQAAHRILSGAFGGKRIATDKEKQVMTQFLLDSAARAVSRREGIDVLLQNYNLQYAQGSYDSAIMKNHIKVCRAILGSVYYLLNNKIEVFDRSVASSIAQSIGPDVDADFVQERVFKPQVLKFLEDKLGLVQENKKQVLSIPLSVQGKMMTEEQAFERIADQYDYDNKIKNALSRLNRRNYEAAIRLAKKVTHYRRGAIIELLQTFDSKSSQSFVDLSERLTGVISENDGKSYKEDVIKALAAVNPRYYEISETVEEWANMARSDYEKAQVIKLFLSNLEVLTSLNAYPKKAEIKVYLSLSAQYTAILFFERLNVPGDFNETVERILKEGRAVYSGIHDFSAKTVSNAHSASEKKPLKQAIVDRLKIKLKECGKTLISYETAIKEASSLAQGNAEPFRNLRKSEVFNSSDDDASAKETFSLVYTLLKGDHKKLELWLSTFLEESLNAHGKGILSCKTGLKERVITSLRGIKIDDEVEQLFAQAEASSLLITFLKKINIHDEGNVRSIAKELRARNVTQKSTPDAAAVAFKKYLTEVTSQYKDVPEYKVQVDAVVDVIKESFKDIIVPFLK